MKKTIGMLCGLTILSACGTGLDFWNDGRQKSLVDEPLRQPSLNGTPQTGPISFNDKAHPGARRSVASAKPLSYGSTLVPPPVLNQNLALPLKPVVVADNSNGRRMPEFNRSVLGRSSGDVLGAVPPPVVNATPLDSDIAVASAPPIYSVQKMDSVALNMPQGLIIPAAPPKNAKAKIALPTQMAKAQNPEIHSVPPLQSVAENMPHDAIFPAIPPLSAKPAPVTQTAVIEDAPAVPSGPTIVVTSDAPPLPNPNSPDLVQAAPVPQVKKVENMPQVHSVPPIQSAANNMPQGSVLPPAPLVAQTPIHTVPPLQSVAESMPQGSVFPPTPPVPVTTMQKVAKAVPPQPTYELAKTTIVVKADDKPAADTSALKIPQDTTVLPPPQIAQDAPRLEPLPPVVAAKNSSQPKLVAQASDDLLTPPAPPVVENAPSPLPPVKIEAKPALPQVAEPIANEPKIIAQTTAPVLPSVVETKTVVKTETIQAVPEPKVVAQTITPVAPAPLKEVVVAKTEIKPAPEPKPIVQAMNTAPTPPTPVKEEVAMKPVVAPQVAEVTPEELPAPPVAKVQKKAAAKAAILPKQVAQTETADDMLIPPPPGSYEPSIRAFPAGEEQQAAPVAAPKTVVATTSPTPPSAPIAAAPVKTVSDNMKNDQYPELANIPAQPPLPKPAATDPRVQEMKQDLKKAQMADNSPAPQALPPLTNVTAPKTITANDLPPLTTVTQTQPAPAPVAAKPVSVVPKGPVFVVHDDGANNSNVETAKAAPAAPVVLPSVVQAAPPPPPPVQPQIAHAAPAGYLVPPSMVKVSDTPVFVPIHSGSSSTVAMNNASSTSADNSDDSNTVVTQPTSVAHSGFLAPSRYERLRQSQGSGY